MKDLRISSLFDDIVEGCRDTAATLDSLKSGDGAIRLCYLPQNEFGADQIPWNTCYGDRYEVVARLTEGGNFVINRDGRDGEPVDTYAFSALKVAACLMAYERNSETRHSGDKLGEGYDEEHGCWEWSTATRPTPPSLAASSATVCAPSADAWWPISSPKAMRSSSPSEPQLHSCKDRS